MNKPQNSLRPDKQAKKTINPIEDRIRELIAENEFYVLRRKSTGEALNVSYTSEGLRWTTENLYHKGRVKRKLSYFADAELRHKQVGYLTIPYFQPNSEKGLRRSNDTIIEKFIPKDHYREGTDHLIVALQVAEYKSISKALKMLYFVPDFGVGYSSDEEYDNDDTAE